MKSLSIVIALAFAGVVASANTHGGTAHTAPAAATAPAPEAAHADAAAPAKKKMAKKAHGKHEEKKEEGATK